MANGVSIIDQVAIALREHGWTAAITTALGLLAGTAAAVTRKAFTNEAVLARLDRELAAERQRVERQRAEDRDADAKRLDRIEEDVRAMRSLLFEAFQRDRDG